MNLNVYNFILFNDNKLYILIHKYVGTRVSGIVTDRDKSITHLLTTCMYSPYSMSFILNSEFHILSKMFVCQKWWSIMLLLFQIGCTD